MKQYIEEYDQYQRMKNRMEIPARKLRLNTMLVSDAVHTGDESPQDSLRDVQTCRTILASAYMLCHLSTVWSQFQIRERSLSWK